MEVPFDGSRSSVRFATIIILLSGIIRRNLPPPSIGCPCNAESHSRRSNLPPSAGHSCIGSNTVKVRRKSIKHPSRQWGSLSGRQCYYANHIRPIQGHGEAHLILSNGTEFTINEALYCPRSRRTLLNRANGFHVETTDEKEWNIFASLPTCTAGSVH